MIQAVQENNKKYMKDEIKIVDSGIWAIVLALIIVGCQISFSLYEIEIALKTCN